MKRILSYTLIIFLLLAVGFYYYSFNKNQKKTSGWSLKNVIFHQAKETYRPQAGRVNNGVKDYTTSKEKAITLTVKNDKMTPAKVKITSQQEIVLKNETSQDYMIKDNKGFLNGLDVKAGKSIVINLVEPTHLTFNLINKNNRVVYKGEIIVSK